MWLVGESVGVEIMVELSAWMFQSSAWPLSAWKEARFNGAQETNIHVKQIPINNRFCIADILLSIQRGIDGLLKSGIRLSAFDSLPLITNAGVP